MEHKTTSSDTGTWDIVPTLHDDVFINSKFYLGFGDVAQSKALGSVLSSKKREKKIFLLFIEYLVQILEQ